MAVIELDQERQQARERLRRTARFGEAAATAGSLEALEDAFREALGDKRQAKYLYVSFDQPFTRVDSALILSNLDRRWIADYRNNTLYLTDPFVRIGLESILPLAGASLLRRDNLTPHEKSFLGEFAAVGLGEGVAVPLHGPGPVRAVLHVAPGGDHSDSDGLSVVQFYQLTGVHFHGAIQRIRKANDGNVSAQALTPREIECLLWAARGKTSWETAQIVKIAEPTVNFHLTNSMRKLEVFSRAHAVARAVALGLFYV